MRFYFLIFLVVSIISCEKEKTIDTVNFKDIDGYLKNYTWYHKDYSTDSLVGISLDKAYNGPLSDKQGKEVVVALIDTEIDIKHEELKGFIWINKNEIPDNNIDDDNNGYIDDINGWNFIATKDKSLLYTTFNWIRVIQKYDSIFKDKNISEADNDTIAFKLYKKSIKYYQEYKEEIKRDYQYVIDVRKEINTNTGMLDSLFGRSNYSLNELDSVYKLFKKNGNSKLRVKTYLILEHRRLGFDNNLPNEYYLQTKKLENISNNLKLDSKAIVDDNIYDIHQRAGYNKVNFNIDSVDHATEIAGVIAANRSNNFGISGINNNVKIMCLPIFGRLGEETDKDLALSIRYAVDNGADIINISASRQLYLNEKWVQEAILYAKEKNVLIVKAAGNEGENVDEITSMPNDNFLNEEKNNFINVGISYKNYGSRMIPDYSAYGKNNVDLFAPGHRVIVTTSNNKFKMEMGSSISAAMVTGVSSLLMSYYPNLTAKEVKQIILDSAVKYDIEIEMADGSLKHMGELSRSGGILNAYEAIKLAEKRQN